MLGWPVAVQLQDLDAGVGKRFPDTADSLVVAVGACRQQAGSVAAAGVEDAVAAGAAAMKVQAEVAQQAAFGMAMTGESLGAVEQKMTEARDLLDRAPDDEEPGPGDPYFTTDTLLLRQATCFTEAGKPARAAALFADVISSGGLSHRDEGFFGARRATALALSGEPDEAARVGLHAAQVARETSSGRTMLVLADVVRTLAPWSSRPGPRALREALSPAPR